MKYMRDNRLRKIRQCVSLKNDFPSSFYRNRPNNASITATNDMSFHHIKHLKRIENKDARDSRWMTSISRTMHYTFFLKIVRNIYKCQHAICVCHSELILNFKNAINCFLKISVHTAKK